MTNSFSDDADFPYLSAKGDHSNICHRLDCLVTNELYQKLKYALSPDDILSEIYYEIADDAFYAWVKKEIIPKIIAKHTTPK